MVTSTNRIFNFFSIQDKAILSILEKSTCESCQKITSDLFEYEDKTYCKACVEKDKLSAKSLSKSCLLDDFEFQCDLCIQFKGKYKEVLEHREKCESSNQNLTVKLKNNEESKIAIY